LGGSIYSMRISSSLLLLTTIFLLPQFSSGSEPADCPKVISLISDEPLNNDSISTFRHIYSELGCNPTFVRLPGRRGIAHFNEGLVDGEFFRLRRVEKAYQRKFVRSSLPLFTLQSALWLHPDPTISNNFPLGYLIGIIWQEQHMKGRNNIGFHSAKKMFDAYSKGRLGGFLGAPYSVQVKVASRVITPAPIMSEILISEPLYHYLGAEYAPVMRQFSEIVRKRNAFSFDGSTSKSK